MAAEWRDTTLDQLGPIITGKTPPSAAPGLFGGDIPFVTPSDFDGRRLIDCTGRYLTGLGVERVATSRIPANAVMVSCIGSDMGKAAIAGRSCVTNQQINSVVVTSDDDARFVYYNLSSRKEEIKASASGSAQPILNKSAFGKLRIRLPPPSEQRAIAHILGTLDDRIELNRRMSETLEAMARSVFKSWFLDFEPLLLKMAGCSRAVSSGDLLPLHLQDSPLGKVPQGWQVIPLGHLTSEFETGSRPPGGATISGMPSIGAESIVGLGVYDFSKTKYVPKDYFVGMTKGRIKNRDILLYKDGGRPGEFEPHVTMFGDGFPFEECAINEHVYRIRAGANIGQNFLFFWLSSEIALAEMRVKGTGVAIPGLNSTNARSISVLVPPSDIVAAFERFAEPAVATVLVNSRQAKTLVDLRDALLPKLLSGELRVREAERTIEAVL
jgi:type I restriction enzyme, S subunit